MSDENERPEEEYKSFHLHGVKDGLGMILGIVLLLAIPWLSVQLGWSILALPVVALIILCFFNILATGNSVGYVDPKMPPPEDLEEAGEGMGQADGRYYFEKIDKYWDPRTRSWSDS